LIVLSSIFSPDERILLSAHGSVEQPINGRGDLYLTDRRLVLIHRSGLIIRRETPLLDVELSQVSYVKAQGTLRRVLVLGVRSNGGQVSAYKVHVGAPDSWVAQIHSLKMTGNSASKYCDQCGKKIEFDAKFCAACGKEQSS
jgi:hypothetical protein